MKKEEAVPPSADNADLRQIVYQKIRDAIVTGLIKPGEKLSEVELADKLAVSRTPVREAIRQLTQSGLVELIPRKGAYVRKLTAEDISDFYDVRLALELLAIERLCSKTPPEELKRFREIFSSFSSDDPMEFVRLDTEFHLRLCEAANNRFLMTIFNNLYDLLQLYRRHSVAGLPLKSLASEHVEIIDAILERDEERAKAAMRNHLERLRDLLVDHFKKNNG